MTGGQQVLVWIGSSAPIVGLYIAPNNVDGRRAAVVSIDGEQYQFAEEIVTGVGRLIEALDRGSVPIPKWGTC